MESLGQRVFARLTSARGDELRVALLMFAYSFLAMTAHNILTPLTEGTFINQFGADNLPVVQLAAGVVVGVIMNGYTQLSERIPRRRVIPVTQAVLVGFILAFWVLLRTGAAWVTTAFFFFGLIFGVLLISQFWTLANDIYDARQAKRLFGFIGGGASLGGALGAAISGFLLYEVGRINLLLFSAAALLGCTAIVTVVLRRQGSSHVAEGVEEHSISGMEAIRLLTTSRHLRAIAILTALGAAGAAIVKQQLGMAAEAIGNDADAIGVFLARVDMYLSLAGFVVQVALTSRIHRSMGLAFALLLLPVALGSTATLILISGALWAPAVARVLDSTLRYTVDKTTREVLFLPLPANLKYGVKPFIDVTTDRLARAGAALVMLPLIKPWGLGLDWQQLSWASLVMTVAWVAMGLVAWREYLRAFRASIVSRDIAPATIRTEIGDASTIEALVEELSNPDERTVVYAIEMLEALDKRNLVTPLLLQHESPRVRAAALRAIAASGSQLAGRWLMAIEGMVQDDDVDVRAAALHALAALAHVDAAVLLRQHLGDAEPRVAVTAAIALASTGTAEDMAAAEGALLQIIHDTRPGAADGRGEAAAALARIEHPRFRVLLVPLLHDPDVSVARKAIGSARALGAADGLFVPGLLSLLGHRVLKAQAREALVGYGEAIVPALSYVLADTREHLWIRRHVPGTLALIGTAQSMEALVAALDEPDGFLRYKAIAAIEKVRRDDPSIACPRQTLEAAVVRETSRYYNGLTLQHNLLRHALDGADSLLGRAIDDKLRRSIDRIYRLLGLLYHIDDVAAARYTIEQGERRRRAAAVEYLDNLLGGVVRRRVMPILDDTPLAEKVRYANAVLRSRPRDLEDTLAQLVHEDDPVIAAAAIHFVGHRQLWGLADDLEYVSSHRPASDVSVHQAAAWALASKQRTPHEEYPVVELVDRIRATPLFAVLSIDELFRVAEVGQEIRHQAGRELYRPGQSADDVFFLLEGALESRGATGAGRDISPPAVVNVEDVLRGTPLGSTVRAVDHTIGFRVPASLFLTMVLDNPLMAQSLFKLVLGDLPGVAHAAVLPPSTTAGRPAPSGTRLFRQDPLLSGATAAQLLALRAAASEVPIARGSMLFDVDAVPAVYQILEGEVQLETEGRATILASGGATFGVAETLAGAPAGWRATGQVAGRALRLDRDDLFAVMADHVDLMQSLFTAALARRDETVIANQGSAVAGSGVEFGDFRSL